MPEATPQIQVALAKFQRDGIAAFQSETSAAVARSISQKIRQRSDNGERIWSTTTVNENQSNYTGDLWQDFPEIENLFRTDIGVFLENYFQARFRIFYGTLYKSDGSKTPPIGSQRWHSDSGPGICVNVMFYLHGTDTEDGSFSALPWKESVNIFDREPAEIRRRLTQKPSTDRRVLMADYYEEIISKKHSDCIENFTGEGGLIIPFLNNTLHRGGHPDIGRSRMAIVFHCYPSHRVVDFSYYAQHGINKSSPYPVNPEKIS